MKISFYVSDHGYGHATRSIGLCRALLAAGGAELTLEILNHHALDLIRRSLSGAAGLTIIDRPTDVGFQCRGDRLAFDPGRTALSVWNWISGWKAFVASEVERLRKNPPDLVVSDVDPQPLLVAEKLGVPSVAVSNFTWVDQYEPHLRPDLVAPLRGSYALALRGYAYSMRTAMAGLPGFVPAGLVTREPAAGRASVRARLGVPEDEPLVHLGFGWAADAVALAEDIARGGLPPRLHLLVSSNLEGFVAGAARPGSVHSIPANDTQSHEAIAACDLVIAKAGYGTVAEAIAGRVPILAVPVEGSRESELIARTVGQLGVGLPYPSDAPWGQELFAEGARMLDDPGRYRAAYGRLPAEYAPGATDRLAATLLALARDPR